MIQAVTAMLTLANTVQDFSDSVNKDTKWRAGAGMTPAEFHADFILKGVDYLQGTPMSGDIYQFGVYTGGIMKDVIRRTAERNVDFGTFWGFDSFVGLGNDAVPGKEVYLKWFQKGEYSASKAFRTNDVTRIMQTIKHGVKRYLKPHQRVELIPGFFDAALTPTLAAEHKMRPALLIDIDCDLYMAAKQALQWMFGNRLVVPGTLIHYDEYGQGGERTAHEEIAKEFNVTFELLFTKDLMGVPEYSRIYRVVSV